MLHAIAEELVGPEGEVWTVAPAFEQSGVAHKISYTHPMMVSELGERLYAAEGSPAPLAAVDLGPKIVIDDGGEHAVEVRWQPRRIGR